MLLLYGTIRPLHGKGYFGAENFCRLSSSSVTRLHWFFFWVYFQFLGIFKKIYPFAKMGIFIYPFPYTHFFKNIRNIPICNIPIFLKMKKIYPFAIFSYFVLKEFYYSDFQKLAKNIISFHKMGI